MAHYEGYIVSNDNAVGGIEIGTLNAPVIITTNFKGVIVFRDKDLNYLTPKARYENNG